MFQLGLGEVECVGKGRDVTVGVSTQLSYGALGNLCSNFVPSNFHDVLKLP